MSEKVGERVRQVRGEMTQAAFAELLGIDRKTVVRYESGERLPDAEFLIKLNVLYKVQPLWLLTGLGSDVAGEKLTPREARLLAAYRAADDQGKAALEAMAAALPAPQAARQKVKGHGNVVANGNVTGVNIGGITVEKKGTKKKRPGTD